MKNVWLFQPTNVMSRSVFLPYSIGSLAAYAWQDDVVRSDYALRDLLFLHEPIETVMQKIDDPFLIGFSCYMWNIEYNLNMAKAIKSVWKDCIIVFGGTQIPENSSFLQDHPFIDVLIFGEGESPFRQLLRRLSKSTTPEGVPGIAYRKNGGIVFSEKQPVSDLTDFPSPYLEGFFDSILQDPKHRDLRFDMILETNRGCPYHCMYCAWGGKDTSFRPFPLERVKKEIQWAAEHQVDYCICADANFGILPRDLEIAEFVAETKKRTGYPHKFETAAAKNKDDFVFQINKVLNEANLNNGVSVSCQSMTPDVLEIIGRKNISTDSFTDLLKKYREAGIPTYTDIIIGLPGETFESFCKSLFSVIEAGQHNYLIIYRCELLPNAPMYSPSIIKKYGIETVVSHLCQSHSTVLEDRLPGSRSEIVVKTNTMSRTDWRKMSRLSLCVQAFHCFGLLRCIAIYLRQAQGISYHDFYMHVYAYIENESRWLKKLLDHVSGSLDRFLQKKGNIFFTDSRFGDCYLPLEEGLFLCAAAEHERFYQEMKPCLSAFFPEPDLFEDLYSYQQDILLLPGLKSFKDSFAYDWKAFFDKIYDPLPRSPIRSPCTYLFNPEPCDSFVEYAREIVWHGKRANKTIISEIERAD